ncbi:MAG: transporter substrate-binding domain-containing protein [Coriobacteriia bacterium]|nr:transporter substrate-binding domain-containing protein [Coriobacteriia bacterium]
MMRRHLGAAVLVVALVALWTVGVNGPAAAEPRTVRVGLYENEPKIFTDDAGEPAGIFVDIIEAIAEEEGWELEYVSGTWSDDLEALSSGEIDLMPDVAYTAERDDLYDFHECPVVESWSYVYVPIGTRVDRISQLEGTRVAVLEGSVQETVFQQMVDGFELDVTLVSADSLEEAFLLVSAGNADAAIANYLFGDYFSAECGLEKTPIVFNAIPLHFATAQGRNADLLDAIDRHLVEWLDEPGSVYYKTIRRYMTSEEDERIPSYIFWILGGAAGLLVLSTALIALLRWQVNVRTRHLLEAQAELEKHREHLEELVEERTRQLEEANSELASISEAKSEFLAFMSHELRTELNSVIGFSEMMLMGLPGVLNDDQRHQMTMINHAGKSLLRLINDALDLAKIESGSVEAIRAPFELSSLVHDVVGTLEVQAAEQELELVEELPEGEVTVDSDEHFVRQILLNLVGNALKFTDAGRVTVTMEEAEDKVVLKVRDTGPGIDPEHLQHVFTPYWQGTDTGRLSIGGAGLGLSISSRLAELMGASLTVDSTPGEGSTFILTLPVDMP